MKENSLRVHRDPTNKTTERRPFRVVQAGDRLWFRPRWEEVEEVEAVVTRVDRLGVGMGSIHAFVHPRPGALHSLCYAFDLSCSGFHRWAPVEDPVKRAALLGSALDAYRENLSQYPVWRERFAAGHTLRW